MSSLDITRIRCSNPEVIKVFSSILKSRDMGSYEDWKDGDVEIIILSRHGVPLEMIRDVSKLFPDDVIRCKYSIEPGWHCYIYNTVQYRCGLVVKENLEIGYSFMKIPLNNKEDREGIYEKAAAFFRRFDKLKTYKNGRVSIEWVNVESSYKYVYECVDGKKYRVEATKENWQIDFLISEVVIKDDWQEISGVKRLDSSGYPL